MDYLVRARISSSSSSTTNSMRCACRTCPCAVAMNRAVPLPHESTVNSRGCFNHSVANAVIDFLVCFDTFSSTL